MTDIRADGDCCQQAAELRREIDTAIGLAERLVGLLLTEAAASRARPQLHVVGQPAAPRTPERLAKIIAFPDPQSASGSRPPARRASGI